jgi:hypothetical protein
VAGLGGGWRSFRRGLGLVFHTGWATPLFRSFFDHCDFLLHSRGRLEHLIEWGLDYFCHSFLFNEYFLFIIA